MKFRARRSLLLWATPKGVKKRDLSERERERERERGRESLISDDGATNVGYVDIVV